MTIVPFRIDSAVAKNIEKNYDSKTTLLLDLLKNYFTFVSDVPINHWPLSLSNPFSFRAIILYLFSFEVNQAALQL
jgi:hypothetical protein